jgi:hypothetical protein
VISLDFVNLTGLPAIASALDSLYDPPSLKLWRAAAAPATEDTAEATAGAENGIRTRDLRFTKPLLYQLSYLGIFFITCRAMKARPDPLLRYLSKPAAVSLLLNAQ